ncbi:MAG: hypothetical protein CVV44_00700 [Spirochaetae bacterium HGW-Spirochaetae-1]|jgi:SAM-dependent methyltransferase|nr:MAG: hypothetical protein CVV44_00700 [Spirochaetae bacterium HGW-Spirochaetae-1]
MDSLGWELTVCNMLEPVVSPVRDILMKNGTFGNLLMDYMEKHAPLQRVKNVLEVGGGYGFLMRDIIDRLRPEGVTMMDISPFLLDKQREYLSPKTELVPSGVNFIESDFFAVGNDFLEKFDLAVFNENIGDFPTVCDIDPQIFQRDVSGFSDDPIMAEIGEMFETYGFIKPRERFNFNLGAVRALERLCKSGVPVIYMSEHSCEAAAPAWLSERISIAPVENPERISLKGHDEYTIRFSHLEKIGRHFGYGVVRNQYIDFIGINYSEKINFILTSHSTKDDHEIIRHFIEDLVKYESLVLVREGEG